jgi:hypothetical protein
MAEQLPRTSLTASMPPGMRAVRFRAEREAEIVGGVVPLIDPRDKDSRQPQMRLVTHCKVFNLLDANEVIEYEKVWQDIADDRAILSKDQIIASPDGTIVRGLLRWGVKTYRVQGQP